MERVLQTTYCQLAFFKDGRMLFNLFKYLYAKRKQLNYYLMVSHACMQFFFKLILYF
jgi:hypothetical protein